MEISTLQELITVNSGKRDRKIGFITSSGQENYLSYEALYTGALARLAYLQEQGMLPGDELVLQVDNQQTFLLFFWAGIIGGIRIVPLSLAANEGQRQKLKQAWQCLDHPYLLTTATLFEKLEINFPSEKVLFAEELTSYTTNGIPYAVRPDDIAFIQFSSGSTGAPKGVTLTHRNLLSNIRATVKASDLTEQDRTLSWMPLTHDMGLIGFHLNPVFLAMDHFLMPTELFVRRPLLWLEKAASHRATVLSSPNFGYKHFLDHFKQQPGYQPDLSTVRLIFNGAEPISIKLSHTFLEALEPFGLKRETMFMVYGLAEATLAVTMPVPGQHFTAITLSGIASSVGAEIRIAPDNAEGVSYACVGRPIKDCTVAIFDEWQENVPEGYVGFIKIKGENVTAAYYNNPEATYTAIQDGWLNTFDLGFFWKENLYITGRAKDIIFVNGQNFYAYDIERAAEALEGIETGKVAACGFQDAKTQEETILLFIQYRFGLPEFSELTQALQQLIAVKLGIRITHFIPVKNIPKTTSGKLQRYLLEEKFRFGEYDEVIEKLAAISTERQPDMPEAAGLPDFSARSLESWIIGFLSNKLSLNKERINPKETFASLGVTSLMGVETLERLKEILPCEINVTDFWSYPDIHSLADYLADKMHHRLVIDKDQMKDMAPIETTIDIDDLERLSEAELAELLMKEIK